MVKELLDKTKQPSAYLIDALEEKEKQVIHLRKQVSTLTNEKDYIQQNYSDLESRYLECELKLKNLMLKRNNIENIQNIMLNMLDKNNF